MDQVWGQVMSQVSDQVMDQIWHQVMGQVSGQVWDRVWDQVRDQVDAHVWDQASGYVDDQVQKILTRSENHHKLSASQHSPDLNKDTSNVTGY